MKSRTSEARRPAMRMAAASSLLLMVMLMP